jgi:hypothetical protein
MKNFILLGDIQQSLQVLYLKVEKSIVKGESESALTLVWLSKDTHRFKCGFSFWYFFFFFENS